MWRGWERMPETALASHKSRICEVSPERRNYSLLCCGSVPPPSCPPSSQSFLPAWPCDSSHLPIFIGCTHHLPACLVFLSVQSSSFLPHRHTHTCTLSHLPGIFSLCPFTWLPPPPALCPLADCLPAFSWWLLPRLSCPMSQSPKIIWSFTISPDRTKIEFTSTFKTS